VHYEVQVLYSTVPDLLALHPVLRPVPYRNSGEDHHRSIADCFPPPLTYPLRPRKSVSWIYCTKPTLIQADTYKVSSTSGSVPQALTCNSKPVSISSYMLSWSSLRWLRVQTPTSRQNKATSARMIPLLDF